MALIQATTLIGITVRPAAYESDESDEVGVASRVSVAVRMMRLISGTQEPQLVPHLS